MRIRYLLLGLSISLSACGGGGDGTSSSAASVPSGSSISISSSSAVSSSSSTSSSLASSVRCNSTAATAVDITTTSVIAGLRNPWGMAFLPDGRILVTERAGFMRVLNLNNTLSADITPLPANIHVAGQGGLLDVALDPDFANNQRIWLSYSETDAATGGNGSLSGTAVASAILDIAASTPTLSGITVAWRQSPKVSGDGHYGARLLFTDDDANAANGSLLFIAVGERQADVSLGANHPAQLPNQTLGKIVRLRVASNGSVTNPADNPFINNGAYLPEIWSVGHRNPQGAALHPLTGQLWTAEHGAQGGDEMNTPEAGKNYGWPVISYGVNYGGAPIGEGTTKADMEQPHCYWDPSIAPSGLAFYPPSGARFSAEWSGNAFVGALAGQALWRLVLTGNSITGYEQYPMGKRIRDVTLGPDGYLYLLTDSSNGEILRVGVTP